MAKTIIAAELKTVRLRIKIREKTLVRMKAYMEYKGSDNFDDFIEYCIDYVLKKDISFLRLYHEEYSWKPVITTSNKCPLIN